MGSDDWLFFLHLHLFFRFLGSWLWNLIRSKLLDCDLITLRFWFLHRIQFFFPFYFRSFTYPVVPEGKCFVLLSCHINWFWGLWGNLWVNVLAYLIIELSDLCLLFGFCVKWGFFLVYRRVFLLGPLICSQLLFPLKLNFGIQWWSYLLSSFGTTKLSWVSRIWIQLNSRKFSLF